MKYFAVICLLTCFVSCAKEKKETLLGKPLNHIPAELRIREFQLSPLDYNSEEWSEVQEMHGIQLDIRYATDQNFTEQKIYHCASCFLRPKVYNALFRAVQDARKEGLGFIIYDCYRPRPFQQKLWDIMPNASYVTPPSKGSMHNRGHAIDLGFYELKSGDEINMGTDFDFFGPEAHFSYTNLPQQIIERRKLLRAILTKHGFTGIRTEWWHFSYQEGVMPFSNWLWRCE